MVKDRLEIFDKLLHHRLHHHAVVVLHVLCDEDGGLAVSAERLHEAALQDGPDVVGGVEGPGLDGHEESDPLIVGSVGGVVLTLHPLQLHDTFEVGLGNISTIRLSDYQMIFYLILRGYVGSPVDPTEVLRQV